MLSRRGRLRFEVRVTAEASLQARCHVAQSTPRSLSPMPASRFLRKNTKNSKHANMSSSPARRHYVWLLALEIAWRATECRAASCVQLTCLESRCWHCHDWNTRHVLSYCLDLLALDGYVSDSALQSVPPLLAAPGPWQLLHHEVQLSAPQVATTTPCPRRQKLEDSCILMCAPPLRDRRSEAPETRSRCNDVADGSSAID